MNEYQCCNESEEQIDELLQLLANHKRRKCLQYLSSADSNTASIDELCTLFTTIESEIALHHKHLPHLENYGVIDWDKRTDTVRYHTDEDIEQGLEIIKSINE